MVLIFNLQSLQNQNIQSFLFLKFSVQCFTINIVSTVFTIECCVYCFLCLLFVMSSVCLSRVCYVQGLLCLGFVVSRVCYVQGLLCLGFVLSRVCYVWRFLCLAFVMSSVCCVLGLLCLAFAIFRVCYGTPQIAYLIYFQENSLRIDRGKCMSARLRFPYNQRCSRKCTYRSQFFQI